MLPSFITTSVILLVLFQTLGSFRKLLCWLKTTKKIFDPSPTIVPYLSLMYRIKIFASILQSRLELHADSGVRATQYGFRKNRSTTQPIHVRRRLLETFERQNTPFHALFLDWSKAFDSVTCTAIHASMAHAGHPGTHEESCHGTL